MAEENQVLVVRQLARKRYDRSEQKNIWRPAIGSKEIRQSRDMTQQNTPALMSLVASMMIQHYDPPLPPS